MPEPISYEAIKIGEELDPIEYHIDTQTVQQYCSDWDDPNPMYLTGTSERGPIMPLAYMAGLACFRLLSNRWSMSSTANVGTEHQNFRPINVGDTMTVKGRVIEKFVRRGLENIIVQSEAYDSQGNLARKSVDRIILSLERKEVA